MANDTEKVQMYEQELSDIADAHKAIIDKVNEIIENTETLKQLLLENYEGESTEVIEQVFVPITKHAQFLKLCYETTQSSALLIRDSMIKMDELLSNNIRFAPNGGIPSPFMNVSK